MSQDIKKTTDEPAKVVKPTQSKVMLKRDILNSMKTSVAEFDSRRVSTTERTGEFDLTFEKFAREKFGVENFEGLFKILGIDPGKATIQSLTSMAEHPDAFLWLVPPIFGDALREGLHNRDAIYKNIISAETSVTMPTQFVPTIQRSRTNLSEIREMETINVGSITFGQKQVEVKELATGLGITDKVQKFTPLNLLYNYLQDVGSDINLKLDAMATEVLINGDQSDGSEAAAVVGVDSANSLTYKDVLKVITRMSRIGRPVTSILSNENIFLDLALLDEFRGRDGVRSDIKLMLRKPTPEMLHYDITGSMPVNNQLMLISKDSALIKLNLSGLTLESERIAQRSFTNTFVKIATGFANKYRDGRVIQDKSVTTAFPDFLNVGAVEANA